MQRSPRSSEPQDGAGAGGQSISSTKSHCRWVPVGKYRAKTYQRGTWDPREQQSHPEWDSVPSQAAESKLWTQILKFKLKQLPKSLVWCSRAKARCSKDTGVGNSQESGDGFGTDGQAGASPPLQWTQRLQSFLGAFQK